jgi:hypothetical protein
MRADEFDPHASAFELEEITAPQSEEAPHSDDTPPPEDDTPPEDEARQLAVLRAGRHWWKVDAKLMVCFNLV